MLCGYGQWLWVNHEWLSAIHKPGTIITGQNESNHLATQECH